MPTPQKAEAGGLVHRPTAIYCPWAAFAVCAGAASERARVAQLEPAAEIHLIEAVREAGIEIRLEGHGAAADKPGAVLLLRAEEVVHALPICGVGDRQAGGLQSHQRAAGGECRSKRLHPDMLFSPFAAGVAGSIRSCQKSRPRSSKRMRSMLSTWWA